MVSALPIDFSEYANNILKNTIGEEYISEHSVATSIFLCDTLYFISSPMCNQINCAPLLFSPQGISAPTTPPLEGML